MDDRAKSRSSVRSIFEIRLHGFCVAKLGNWIGSYNNAAILISSLSIWSVMFACAQTVRMWCGSIAGGATALLIAMSVPVADASQWGNLYPMLAGGIALCVWASSKIWVDRRGLILAGLIGGYAWAIDPRALPFVLLVACSVVWNGMQSKSFDACCSLLFCCGEDTRFTMALEWPAITISIQEIMFRRKKRLSSRG